MGVCIGLCKGFGVMVLWWFDDGCCNNSVWHKLHWGQKCFPCQVEINYVHVLALVLSNANKNTTTVFCAILDPKQ